MTEIDEAAAAWLEREDRVCRSARLERLTWIVQRAPASGIQVVSGGWMSMQLYEEARYSYVYGQFASAAILGFAFVERTLASLSYRNGNDGAARATSQQLVEEAVADGLLPRAEGEAMQRARLLRNPLTHFRRPLHPESVEYRADEEDADPEEVLAADAREIIDAMFRLMRKQVIG